MSHVNDYEIQEHFKRGLNCLSEVINETKADSLQEDITQGIHQFVVMFTEWGIEKKMPSKALLDTLESLSNGKTFSLVTASGRKLCSIFKSYLLEKTFEVTGFESAFHLYNKYKDHHPVTQFFFETMIRICSEANQKDHILDSVFEDYSNEFGSTNHKLWIEYAKHLLESNRITLLSNLHYRAVKRLKGSPEEVKSFIQKYSRELM
jgi:hypothetical protein